MIPYTSSATDVWDALKVIDADPANPDNVLGIYSRRSMPDSLSGDSDGWNREHSWPKSCGVGYEGPDFSDLHHLFPADWSVNSARGNKDFGDCVSDGTPTCEAPGPRGGAGHGGRRRFVPAAAVDQRRHRPRRVLHGDALRRRRKGHGGAAARGRLRLRRERPPRELRVAAPVAHR